MIGGPRPFRLAGVVAVLMILEGSGCARPPFDQYLAEHRWTEASQAFVADSALMNNEDALYRAGLLYSSPDRPTYDPARAQLLLQRLLSRFPNTRYRAAVTDRLALVDDVVHVRDSVATREHDVETQIANLTAQVQRLRAGLDSAAAQNDLLRRDTLRLQSDLHDRDDQLRTLRLELQRLKEIDLKPRPPKG